MIIFIAAIFLSAFLLFAIQPMLGKLLLPYLGGGPTVWNTAMMVYQALLLGGYGYAHLMRDRVGGHLHVKLHLGLLAASLLTMPVVLVTGVWADPTSEPALWLVLSLLASAGLPFFLLSANAPLIQSWFAASGHPRAANPYFLYSASNLGSFLALVSYPFVIERFLGMAQQLSLWSWGYGVFAGLLGLIGVGLLRRGTLKMPVASAGGIEDAANGGGAARRPGLKDRLFWIALAFVPSSLLLGVTQYLTTDIAAFPLLWVIPLALYLLTFVIAFSRVNDWLLKYTLNVQLLLLFAAVFTLALKMTNDKVMLLHIAAFFIVAYVCHGRLAASRPHARHLTEFYLWVSVGGVLGGIFNALAAPTLFTGVWEYPLALLAAALLRPATATPKAGADKERTARPVRFKWPGFASAPALGAVAFGVFWLAAEYGDGAGDYSVAMSAAFTILFVGMFALARKRPARVFAMMAATLVSAEIFSGSGDIIFRERNFFGTLRVYREADHKVHTMVHGTTVHGFQSLEPERRLEQVSYYRPLTDIFPIVRKRTGLSPVALVGLGAGTVVCQGEKGQPFDIYEINPAVVRAATNRDLFSYLSDCPPKDDIEIILGDARLSMEKAPDGRYGLIILDAYNSDSLPVHLLTREALSIYVEKMKPNGILALHISNNHLDLGPVVQALADDLDLWPFLRLDDGDDDLLSPSEWIVLARKDEIGSLLIQLPEQWELLPPSDKRVWTDNYSNIIGSLK